jgi:hypothetical protein
VTALAKLAPAFLRPVAPVLASCALAVLGCGEATITSGLEEPFRVASGQFVEGALPGLPPIAAGEQSVTPTVTGVGGISKVRAGERARGITGTASDDALSVGIRFADLGSGYWVRPVTVVNLEGGGFSWQMQADIGIDVPPGVHQMLFAAIGADGRSGSQRAVEVCVEPEVPDRRSDLSTIFRSNACDPTQPPPALVVSLGWESEVDLDLQVVTPSGKLVDPKHPTTAVPNEDGDIDTHAPGVGNLDGDSNAACAFDGRSRENLVFDDQPASGRYAVYVSLFDACGERSVDFTVSLHTISPGAEPDTFRQVESYRQAGRVTALQADGGARIGLFVTEFVVP